MTTNYVVAPREPTPEMKNRGRTENSEHGLLLAEATYHAMLAAIPDDPNAPVLVERETHDLAMAHVKQLEETVARQAAELEALKRDAERYRWLRNGQSVQIFEVHEKWTSSHRLDAVIDAAIAKERRT